MNVQAMTFTTYFQRYLVPSSMRFCESCRLSD